MCIRKECITLTTVGDDVSELHSTFTAGCVLFVTAMLPAGLFSIEILAMCPGGSWKPLSEWEALFTSAKLKLESVKAVGCNMHLMCFVKA